MDDGERVVIDIVTVYSNFAYIIWIGVCTVLIVLVSIIFLGEDISFVSLIFMTLILVGTIGLTWVTKV